MNPFDVRPVRLESTACDWRELYLKPYDKREVNPRTRIRIILMNGTEFEQVWFSHQFQRHAMNNDLRRDLALLRRLEQQQQKRLASLKPLDETPLEHTLGYEQLAVELTASLAQNEPNANVKHALDFALLEDFDHLYRYANLMDTETGEAAEMLTGGLIEITPGRPTISEHRHPFDSPLYPIDDHTEALITCLHASVITAAEQQTMNYYMNLAATYPTDCGRKLYQEIGTIEEQHVTQYGSLIDPKATWLEGLLMHQYTECWLYWPCHEMETDARIKGLWAQMLEQEIAHLHKAAGMLLTWEGKHWQQVIPGGAFPPALTLGSSIDYVRGVLASTVEQTQVREEYQVVTDLPDDFTFFSWQSAVNRDVEGVPSHRAVDSAIARRGFDYRFETGENPVPDLRDRAKDNTAVGRAPEKVAAQIPHV